MDGHPGGTLSQETTDVRPGTGGKRRPYPPRAAEKGQRRLSGPVVVSIAVHVVVGAALLRILLVPYPFTSLFATKSQPVEPERISFLALPRESPLPTPGKSGGNGRPVNTKATPAPPLVAPTSVPTALPPAEPSAPPTPTPVDEGTGPLI